MSGVIDVGDAFELTFTTAPGASVDVSWFDPGGVTVLDHVPVPESPPGSGKFPRSFLATAPDIWRAVFTASGAATDIETYYVRAVSVDGPAPLATVGEVGIQFGSMTEAQEGLTAYLLRVASKIVRQRFPQVDTQITAGSLDPEVVGLAVSAMVLRVLRNPGGLRSETVGPFSRTYDTGEAAGLLVVTDKETAMLTPTRSTAFPVGTIMMRPGLAPPPEGLERRGWGW